MASGKTALDYLGLMERRNYPFRLVQAALRDNDLPTAQGWEPLRDKYQHFTNAKDPAFVSKLASINLDLMLYAQKAVAFYPIEPKEAKNFGQIIEGLSPSNAYSASYPFTLQGPQLASLSTSLSAAAVETTDSGEQLLLAGKIYETERSRIEVADLGTAIPSPLSGFDEVIAIRRTARQFFHTVTIRNRQSGSYVEIRLDTLGHFLADDYVKHFKAVKRWLNKKYESVHGTDTAPINAEVNLFLAISRLYKASDGRVHHLGATTNTASVKQERMRRKADDLRKEAFHAAGKSAADLNEFNIEKTWDSTTGSTNPSIEIPGRISDASAQAQHIPMALIHGCADTDDFELVISKLFTALKI